VVHDMLEHSGDFYPSFIHEINYNYKIDDDLKSGELPSKW